MTVAQQCTGDPERWLEFVPIVEEAIERNASRTLIRATPWMIRPDPALRRFYPRDNVVRHPQVAGIARVKPVGQLVAEIDATKDRIVVDEVELPLVCDLADRAAPDPCRRQGSRRRASVHRSG